MGDWYLDEPVERQRELDPEPERDDEPAPDPEWEQLMEAMWAGLTEDGAGEWLRPARHTITDADLLDLLQRANGLLGWIPYNVTGRLNFDVDLQKAIAALEQRIGNITPEH